MEDSCATRNRGRDQLPDVTNHTPLALIKLVNINKWDSAGLWQLTNLILVAASMDLTCLLVCKH